MTYNTTKKKTHEEWGSLKRIGGGDKKKKKKLLFSFLACLPLCAWNILGEQGAITAENTENRWLSASIYA